MQLSLLFLYNYSSGSVVGGAGQLRFVCPTWWHVLQVGGALFLPVTTLPPPPLPGSEPVCVPLLDAPRPLPRLPLLLLRNPPLPPAVEVPLPLPVPAPLPLVVEEEEPLPLPVVEEDEEEVDAGAVVIRMGWNIRSRKTTGSQVLQATRSGFRYGGKYPFLRVNLILCTG